MYKNSLLTYYANKLPRCTNLHCVYRTNSKPRNATVTQKIARQGYFSFLLTLNHGFAGFQCGSFNNAVFCCIFMCGRNCIIIAYDFLYVYSIIVAVWRNKRITAVTVPVCWMSILDQSSADKIINN